MASKDYDDLLQSFMNNSSKAYDEDQQAQKEISKTSSSNDHNKTSLVDKERRGRNMDLKLEKKSKNKQVKKTSKEKKNRNKSPAARFFGKVGKVALGLLMICGVVGIVCFSVMAVYGYSVVYGDKVFDLTEEKNGQSQTSFIYGYDESGKTVEITRLHGEENRIWVDLKDMSPYLPKAAVAIEDERFYKHHGVDWMRTIKVTVLNLIGRSEQGGSTITQQLIKNLTDQNQVTFIRKFNEVIDALNIERNYSKDQILEAYLNTIYLSNGCYGVKTAAEVYFGKDVKNLNIAECACLVSITQSPSDNDPLRNLDENLKRQRTTMLYMKEQGSISDAEYSEARAYDLILTNSENYKGSQIKDDDSKKSKDTVNNYYTDYVITTVMEDLQKMGYTAKKSKDLVYGGGLKIYTAVDFNVQKSLEDVYENRKKITDNKVQSAMVVMDYEGRVLGLVGGTGKKKANLTLNRATQSKRQPGSTIKPLSVYGPALQKSLDDDDTNIYWSTPIKDAPLMEVDGKRWPTNQGGGFSGNTITLQHGLANSLNTISARTLDMITPSYSFDYITDKFHISTLDNVNDVDYAPMATGAVTNGVTVLEMTAAYASFGNGGQYYDPYCYYKIEDNQGNVLIEQNPEKNKEESLSTNTAWVMNKLLQTVMTSGTGTSYKLPSIECFGKTGTTTDDKDRWFIGGTPNFVAGVWYGYDQPKEITYNLSYNPCGTLWKTVLTEVYDNMSSDQYDKEFAEVDGIVRKSYCPSCGKLRSGTGVYGWYDVNNLPGYCSGGHYSSSSSSNSSGGSKTTTKKSSDSKTTSSAVDTTAQETTAPPTTLPPETTVPVSQ